jgi:hypothetical protein
MSTAIIPYQNYDIAPRYYEFKLVEENVEFLDRETVKQRLPDILGRALARSWIDDKYKEYLQKDLKGTLASGGVLLPDEYDCVFEKSGTQRAKIVVYEQQPNSKLRLRICGFSLTMMASR